MEQMYRNVNVSKFLSSKRKYWNIFIMLAFPSRRIKPSISIKKKKKKGLFFLATYIFKVIYGKNTL